MDNGVRVDLWSVKSCTSFLLYTSAGVAELMTSRGGTMEEKLQGIFACYTMTWRLV